MANINEIGLAIARKRAEEYRKNAHKSEVKTYIPQQQGQKYSDAGYLANRAARGAAQLGAGIEDLGRFSAANAIDAAEKRNNLKDAPIAERYNAAMDASFGTHKWEKGKGFFKNVARQAANLAEWNKHKVFDNSPATTMSTDSFYSAVADGIASRNGGDTEAAYTQLKDKAIGEESWVAEKTNLEEWGQKLDADKDRHGKGVQFAGSVAEAAPTIMAAIAASLIPGDANVAAYGLMGAATGGNTAREAYRGGADITEAVAAGAMAGLSEIVTEKITGGIWRFGKGLIDKPISYVAGKISKPWVSKFVKYIAGSLGEGAEEILTEEMQYQIESGVWNNEAERLTAKEYLEVFGVGAVLSLVFGTHVFFDSKGKMHVEEEPKQEETTNEKSSDQQGTSSEQQAEDKSREEEKEKRFWQRVEEISLDNPTITWTDKQMQAVYDMVEREMAAESNSTLYSTGSVVSEDPNVKQYALPPASLGSQNETAAEMGADFGDIKEDPSPIAKTKIEATEGFTPESLYSALRLAGYDDATINDAMVNVFGENQFSSPAAEPVAESTVPNNEATQAERTTSAFDKANVDKVVVDSQPNVARNPKGSAKTSAFRTNTLKNSGIFSDVEKQQEGLRPEDMTYDPVGERESMRQAADRLESDYEGEKSSLETKEGWNGVDLDASMQILRDERDAARKSGDYSQVIKWVNIIREKGTQAGQMIQAFAKYSRTPESVLVKTVNTMRTCGADAKTQERVIKAVGDFSTTLDAIEKNDVNALIDLIRKQAEVRKTKFGKAEEWALKQQTPEFLYDFAIIQMENIANDYQAVSFGQKLSTYQAVSHLLNVKTALRNLVSNTTFDVVDSAAQNAGMIPDAILSIFTGKRTVGFDKGIFGKAKLKGAIEGGARSFAEVSLDVDVTNGSVKYEHGSRRTNKAATSGVFGRIMSAAEKAMGIELNVTDEAAKGGIAAEIADSLKPFVKKGSLTEAEAIEIAEETARYRTFQDENMVSSVLSGLKDVLNIVGFGTKNGRTIKGKAVHDFGAGDLLQKYTQVPGSLICRSLEFSPVGYAKAIYSLCKAIGGGMAKVSPKQQRDIALAFSRATTGTGLIIAAAALVKAGILSSTDSEDDKDRKALLSAQGMSGTQINLDALARWISGESSEWQNGDNLVSVDFMEPLNSLFSTGYIVAQDNEIKAKSLVGANIESIYRSIKDITTMQSIASINNAIQYHDEDSGVPLLVSVPIEVGLTSLTGFIPSPIRQVSRALDPYYRETYNTTDRLFGKGEGVGEYAQTAADKIKSVTPASKMLPEKLDPFGRIKEYGETPAERWLNSLVAPGNISTYETTDVEEEINRLYDRLDNASIYPDRNAPNTIGNKGKEWELTGTDKQEYLETSGQTAFDAIQDLIATPEYKNASDSKKAEMISDALKYGKYTARMEYYESQKIKVDDDSDGKRVYELVDAGFSNADSLILYTDLKAKEKDKDKRRYLYNSEYTDQEIKDIVEVYGLASDKCNEVWEETKNLNIPYRKYLEAYYILSSSETGYKKAEKISDAKSLGIDESKVLKLWDLIH